MNETMKTILNRRSTRAFKNEQIPGEDLELILQAGQFAPSAINEQPWHFTVVQNKELLHKINEACRALLAKSGNKMFEERVKDPNFSVFYHAPTFIIVSGDAKAMLPQIDCAIALENMFLAAESLGIGSCWIHAVANLFDNEEGKSLKNELGIPDQYAPFCSGAFGYKAMDAAAPPRKENIVSFIK